MVLQCNRNVIELIKSKNMCSNNSMLNEECKKKKKNWKLVDANASNTLNSEEIHTIHRANTLLTQQILFWCFFILKFWMSFSMFLWLRAVKWNKNRVFNTPKNQTSVCILFILWKMCLWCAGRAMESIKKQNCFKYEIYSSDWNALRKRAL